VCTHTNSNPTWFEEQAAHVSWTVYCAVLPSAWSVDSAGANYNSGGSITVNYKSSGGATLTVKEMGSSAGIKLGGTDSGPVKFGDLNAELYDDGAGQYVVWASGGGGYYWAQSTGMSGMNLSDLMNSMHHVSK
jgi:hypothetical protein